MKKLFTLLSLTLFFGASYAQYCGSSQVSAVNPGSGYGFPKLDSIACIVQGANTTLDIPFRTYTHFTAQGNPVTIYKLRIDEMSNLPCGLCWSTNKATNEFSPDEYGTFRIQGTTNDAVGEYKIHLLLSVATQNANNYDVQGIDADAGGVYLYLRVMAANGSCAPVDTSSLGLTASTQCPTGINDMKSNVTSLTVQPNPMSSEANVTFTSEVAGTSNLTITNIVGSVVYRTAINTRIGENATTISKGNLPAGIYILTVGNNKATASRKFVIAE
ncbi:MAG: T9SS type A sorting domain-containing protein [Bacteroidetes bacterium]|nr:T9SS type A sorting domain-containing protein [Bacteroidota bacterium]MBS1684026.1 T9SS type A sorting domain-containing protein [Bacteroidota bacterium]